MAKTVVSTADLMFHFLLFVNIKDEMISGGHFDASCLAARSLYTTHPLHEHCVFNGQTRHRRENQPSNSDTFGFSTERVFLWTLTKNYPDIQLLYQNNLINVT